MTRLISIFNGNIVLNKVHFRFHEWLKEYNLLYGFKNSLIIPGVRQKKRVRLILESAWFSGFTDAEGGFYASLTKNNKLKFLQPNSSDHYRLRMKFYITQKNELRFLKKVIFLIHEQYLNKTGASLQFNLLSKSKPKPFNEDRYISTFKSNINRLEISTEKYILIILDYFQKYPLQGKKKIVFNRWKRIFYNKNLLKNKNLKSEKAFIRFQKLVQAVQLK
uniref:hypothetical protein n=1 Tax=Symbiochloris sp. SG-2018 TaxID=2126034 RepID=UPI00211474D4|nr:hypothetical protein NRL16_pgp075 [Symbiochloris sp. SG-2018]UTQ75695.1 hypothetical protein [Symbiochloris sp. SG-2018]